MKGIVSKTVAGVCGAGLLAAAGGCYTYRDLVDTCYPERYEAVAQEEVKAAMAPQVQNGHILDLTIWNYHFVPGSEELHQSGLYRLNYLAQRRPSPDSVIFLQTAQDVAYNPAAPDRFAQARKELDKKREESIKNYLTARTAGRNVEFQVVTHDPPEAGIAAVITMKSIQQMNNSAKGSLGSSGGGGSSSGAAGTSGSSSGGGSTGSGSGH